MSNSPFRSAGIQVAQPFTFPSVAASPVLERIGFIRRTYLHLAGAIGLFVILEFALFAILGPQLGSLVAAIQGWAWLAVIGAAIFVSWIAERWASSSTSRAMQYAGLGLYTLVEAVVFLPLLYVASTFFPGSIQSAAIISMIVFGGLTLIVFITQFDFSFLRMALYMAGLAAFAISLVSIIMQINLLGTAFSAAMVLLASGYILYHTSNVLHQYRPEQHVAAALALFASVALLFYYVLRLVISLQQD
jgi:hypothetical protein